jgi:hypothetical protein
METPEETLARSQDYRTHPTKTFKWGALRTNGGTWQWYKTKSAAKERAKSFARSGWGALLAEYMSGNKP